MAKNTKKKTVETISYTFEMQELTKLLLQNKGITEGFFVTHLTPNIKGGFVDMNKDEAENPHIAQGIIIAFDKVELRQVESDVPSAVDASQLNN